MNFKTALYTFQYKLQQKLLAVYYGFLTPPSPEVNSQIFAPNKVLFVLSGLLGDSVMSVPAIIEARRIWHKSHFTLLGKKHNHELLSACPLIDEFYECNSDPFSLRKSGEIKNLQKWLNSQKFDLAIILLGDQFAHLLAKAKIPVRVGVKGTLLESCLTHIYEIGSQRIWGAKERLNALCCLGYEVKNELPRLWIDENARKSAREKLLTSGLLEKEKYIVLHPFGSTPRQWWNIRNITPFANQLREKENFRTVLVGGQETVSCVEGKIDDSIINTTGKLTLPELLAVIDDSDLVITTDSGPFHIAGALQKPILGLFRARRPEHAKQYPTAKILFGQNENCQNLCKWDYCSENPCRQLERISTEDVVNFLN